MESTGVYWIPLYEILEARGFEVVLVNARHVKNVPGRKSDVTDCEWLRELHSVGLLRGSFRPAAAIAVLRAYLRHRETLVESAATHIQRMQKALVQMNLQLHLIISDITGVTGLRILRDIVAGRTNPQHLAQYRDPRCHASEAEIAAALTGHYRPEHLFALQQNLELFDIYQHQLAACDAAIEVHLHTLAAEATLPATPLPEPRSTTKPRHNEPRFEIRAPLHQLTGVDLTQLDAIGPYSALRLLAEIGTDMSRWPTEKHFTSWLTLAP
jgi:transposase